MKQLSSDIADNSCVDTKIVDLMRKLHGQLQNTKGKKVYGYLNKDTKQTVDEIFLRLSQNESIQKMYKLWCDMEQSKHDFYSSAKVDFPSMVDNEHFKSVKNMIIHSAMERLSDAPLIESEDAPDTNTTESDNVIGDINEVSMPLVANENSFAGAALGLLLGVSRFIYEDYDKEQRKLYSKVDKKLRKAIECKRLSLGDKKIEL